MKKHIFLTSYVELADLVDMSNCTDSEEENKPKEKKVLKRKMVKVEE